MMIITKNQKPVSVDASFKYICPNDSCGCEHWLFLAETQTKNFKVVCECGCVFKPKRIENIKILYSKNRTKPQPETTVIPSSLLNQCCGVLISYGFDKAEAHNLLTITYSKYKIDDPKTLIKQTLLEIPAHG
jgi:uncharacterized protein YchJ